MAKQIIRMEKKGYVNWNRKDIASSSNNLANCDGSNKNDIKYTNSKIRNSVYSRKVWNLG